FSFVNAHGFVKYKGKKYNLRGKGSMEHILTNYSFGKIANRWQITRAFTEGKNFVLYGYQNKRGKSIRTFIVRDRHGRMLDSGKITKVLAKKYLKAKIGNGTLLEKGKMLFHKKCWLTTSYTWNGSLSLLQGLPIWLRVFVRAFFANPHRYQLQASVQYYCQKNNRKIYDTFLGKQVYYKIK
ncbi:MAG: hypothetical protein AAF518_28685, partial [Spirochaetota bacterium]